MNYPRCPKCTISLKPFSLNGLNYLSCNSCDGQFVSLFNLNQSVDNNTVIELWNQSFKANSHETRTCPSCVGSMKVFNFNIPSGNTSIEVDLCRPCKSIWLDSNEEAQLAGPNELTPSTPKILNTATAAASSTAFPPIEQGKKNSHFQSARPPGGLATLITLMGMPIELKKDVHKKPPIITWLLIVFSVISSFMAFTDETLFNFLQFSTNKPFAEQIRSSVTVFFVHGGWMHLIGNMYFLFVFGDNVESDLGKFRYILLVVLGTLVSTFAFTFTDNSGIPLVGASGGISALMGYYLLRFPKRKFVVSYFLNWFYISSMVFGALYILKDLAGMFMGGSNVAHISHLSGVVIGAIFYFIFKQRTKLNINKKYS